MDPKDPISGGLQAKDKDGVKKTGGKVPGKVANTDQYGQGGIDAVKTPGKTSGTEHLPDGLNGKESKAAINEAAGKGPQPPAMGPVQLPQGKEPEGGPKKPEKKGAAPAKGDGSLKQKQKAGGDVNHAAGPAIATDAVDAQPFMPMMSEPAKTVDVPTVATFDAVVVDVPAGKVQPSHEQLRTEVTALGEQIKAAHDEILGLAKTLEKQVATQLQEYAGTIEQRVQSGTERVGNAYNGLSKAVTDESNKANEAITKREQSIPAHIKQVRDAKGEELKGLVTKVKTDTSKAIMQGPEALAARKAAKDFAAKLDAMGGSLVTEIKTKTTAGGELTKGMVDPKSYSVPMAMMAGEGARTIGHKALVADKRLSLITSAGKQAIGLIEGTVKEVAKGYREDSDTHLTDALKASDEELDKVITQVHEPEQQKQLDAAANLATESLQKQVTSARTGLTKAQKDATTRIANERKSAEDGAKKAGKALADNIKHGSKEIENRIASKAAQDAASYTKLNGELKKISKSKKLDAATKATLDTMKADLTAAQEQHKSMLTELATTSVAELKKEKEAQYEKAIAGYEEAAGKTKQELVGKMSTGITQLGQSFDTIGTSFDATVQDQTSKMKIDLDFYKEQAHGLPDLLSKRLDKMVTQTEAGLRAGTADMLKQETVQSKLNKKSEPSIIAAKKKCEDAAHSIWDAMDGAGTDENKIFAALRTATPGEIVYIEGEYNAAYPNRGTGRYPSPLQADLDDELSGGEWDIAFAYLRHEREKALKLELDDSRGIFNDEEERIQDVLKAASDDELKNILTSADGQAVMTKVKDCLSGCDLDVVNALTEMDAKTGMPVADRKVKADAILIYQAMYGGTGIGTDEAKIKKILEETTDPKQRELLAAKYAEYIRVKDPLQAYRLEREYGKGNDLLDSSIQDEMSGGEETETRAQAEYQLSQDDHLKLVKMAKVVEGAHGAGTDEDKIVDNIDTDEEYYKKYQAEKDPEKRKVMAQDREKAANARLRWLEGSRVDENGEPLKDQDGKPITGTGPNVMPDRFKGESIADIIKGEMGSEDITFEELQQGKWGPYPDRGDKNGKDVTVAPFQQRARAGMLNLEYMVAQRKLQAGMVDPELLIAYACWGVSGTDEANLKKGLKKGGELRTKAELTELRTKFKAVWGVDLMDGQNEIEVQKFKEPTGVVPSEVSGKDWLEIRIALMGKPETPQDIAYVDNVRYKFVTSGTGSPSPFSHAREDMEVNHKRIQDEAAKAVAENKPLNSFDASKAKKPERKDFKTDDEFKSAEDKFYESKEATEGMYLEGNRLEILAGYAERSEMAFLTAKEAMADAIITVIELIGAALITAASMGASSPMLAMFIGNLILSGMTIMMRKDMVGDAYGSEEIGIDVIKGIVMAAIQAAGEAKVVADFAKKAGQYGGSFAKVFTGGAEKAGMKVVGKEGLELAEAAAMKLEAKVGAKLATEGGEKAAVAGGKEVAEKVATKEATDVAEKVATKEATDVAEKAVTKEATNVAEKAAVKEATSVAEKAAVKEGAQAAKKTTAEYVESSVEAGVKNVTTTTMSETATFLMDEKTWEMKGFEAMFGEGSIGARILKSIPNAFVQGAVGEYIDQIANAPSPGKVRKPASGSEAVFRKILSEVGGNTAGFLVYLDNYSDAGAFWQELLKSNAKSLASGGFNGYFGHAMRATKLGRDAFVAFKDGDQAALHEALAQIMEADGYMQLDEKQRVVDRIMKEPQGAEVMKHLPESFQQLVSKQTQAGGSVTGPGGDTAPDTNGKKSTPVAEEKKSAPATEEKKVAPATEEKKVAPAAEEKKGAPAVEEKKVAPAEEKKDAPVAEEKKVAPPDDEKMVAPAAEEKKVAPATEEKKAAGDTIVDPTDPKVHEATLAKSADDLETKLKATPEGTPEHDALKTQLAGTKKQLDGVKSDIAQKAAIESWSNEIPRREAEIERIKNDSTLDADAKAKALAHAEEKLAFAKSSLDRSLASPEGAGPTVEKADEVTATKKGDRPDPKTYLSPAVQQAHAEAFADGGSRLVTKASHDKYGTFREDGTTFLMTKADCDALLARAGGDPRKLEQELGLPEGQLGDGSGLLRIDFPPQSLRIPSGNEAGANSQWIPGGRTPNGSFEAVVDKSTGGTPVITSAVPATPDKVEPKKSAPVAEEKKSAPVAEEKKSAPVAEEKKSAPAAEEKKVASVADDDQKVAPVAEEKKVVPEDKKAAVTDEAPAKTAEVTTNDSTKTGATLDPSKTTDNSLAGNETVVTPQTAGRAKSALDAMSAPDRHAVQAVMDLAKTPGQKAMLEKAIAAGRTHGELEILRAAMADLSDVEIAKTFSGAGVIQFFHQSCAPTAYQIAIADVDPFFAFYLRQHPELVMEGQRNVLVINGGAQTKRDDIDSDEKSPAKNLQPHLDDSSMGPTLRDGDQYSPAGSSGGVDMPDLDGSNLHKLLEKSTGMKYEVVTNVAVPFKNKGAGQYDKATAPHDRIVAAVQAGHPVIVGQYMPGMMGGHAMTIVGVDIQGEGPNRVITYKVRDPMSGTIAPIDQRTMDAWGTQGFTLPKMPAKGDDAGTSSKHQGPDASKDAGADDKSTKTGGGDKDTDPNKTWDDAGKQTEKPDPESFTDAHARRSKPITPGKDADDATKWASPDNRQAIPETVPLSRQEVRDIVMAKYGATLEPYTKRDKTSDDAFLPLIEKLRNEPPGGARTEEGRKRQDDYEAEWDRISAEVAKKPDRHDDSELRTFYNLVEKEDFKHIWAPAIGHLPLEQQARLMHMYREELKIMVRDLMSDENSKEVLYLRDRFGSGDRRGARFEDLVEKNMPKAKGDENAAMQMVINSSMRSNEKFNLAKTGYADGIKPEVGDKIRGESKDPTKELENVRAKNAAKLDGEANQTKTGAGPTNVDDAVVPHAKLQQESSATRRNEINLADNKPMVRLEGEPKDVRHVLDHLWENREELKGLEKKAPDSDRVKELKRDIATAEQDLALYLSDPLNKDNLLNPHVAFALAREAAANKSPELTGFLRKHIDEFRKAQDQARQGADPQLRAKRELFEREIAKAIISGPLMKQVDANLDLMCKKALDYISKLPEDRQAKFLAALGGQADSGYAGAVLKGSHPSQNAMVMVDVLLSGNIRERMMTLGNFATAVAADMHANAKDFDNVKKQAGSAGPEGFGAGEVERYEARMAQYRADQEKKKVDASTTNDKYTGDFLKPTSAEKSGDQSAYQTLKNQEMDAKIPSLPTGEGVFHNSLQQSPSAKVKQGETGAGESSSLARQGMTVKEAQAQGYNLSQREIDAAGGPDGVLPWLTGTIANVVDPSAAFIKEGAEASMPQKAGISGTTFRFMEATALLGGDAKMSRLAAIGALQMIDAHTIYEIAHASKGFGLEFNAKRPYDSLGIDPELLSQLALATGSTYAELNGETAATPTTPNE